MAQAPTLNEPIAPADRPFTVDDWFALPEEWKYWELYEGRLCYVPAPTRSHQDAVGRIFYALMTLSLRDGGYVGIAPLGVALSEQVGYEPDVVYVVPGREAILTERGIEGVPDLVVEVLSPSTRAFDSGPKLRSYLDHGVREVWLVDIESRTVTVHAADGVDSVPFGADIPSRLLPAGTAGLV